MIWPNSPLEPLVTITPTSAESGVGNAMYNGGNLSLNTYAQTAWPSANLAIYVPFFLSKPITFSTMFWMNGSTVAGNVDVGVYAEDGTRIVSKGSTAAAGTTTLQVVTVTTTTIGPGLFYLALACSSTSELVYKTIIGQVLRTKFTGMAQQATALPLPATATFATVGQDYVPLVGLSTRSSI